MIKGIYKMSFPLYFPSLRVHMQVVLFLCCMVCFLSCTNSDHGKRDWSPSPHFLYKQYLCYMATRAESQKWEYCLYIYKSYNRYHISYLLLRLYDM